MLSSASNTALSAMRAAEVAMAVTANNLANAQTDGFRASRVVLATQAPRQVRVGNAAVGDTGGTNPQQIGSGVQVAAIEADSRPGPQTSGPSPLSLLLTGRGLFILEGSGGEQLYANGGQFQFNAGGELVLPSGQRVLGYNVDPQQQLDPQLAPLTLPASLREFANSPNRLSVDQAGVIRGTLADGTPQTLGQLAIAEFSNPAGLEQRAGSVYAATPSSGTPLFGDSQTSQIVSGARQLSSTNIAEELVELSFASLLFRLNLEVIETEQEMLDDLLNLRRPR